MGAINSACAVGVGISKELYIVAMAVILVVQYIIHSMSVSNVAQGKEKRTEGNPQRKFGNASILLPIWAHSRSKFSQQKFCPCIYSMYWMFF